MSTFKIGQFLRLEGEQLSVQVNGQRITVTGFTSARLTEATTLTDIRIECSDGGPGPDDGQCRLEVNGFTGDHHSGQVELRDGREASLRLRWAIPLSPLNEGLWFHLEFERTGNRYLLNTQYSSESGLYLRDTNTAGNRYMHNSFAELAPWDPPLKQVTLQQWVTRWNAWSPDNTTNTEFWSKSDFFNSASPAAVLLPVGKQFASVAFSLGFEKDKTEGALRLLLKLRLTPEASGARIASRALFHTDDSEDPVGPVVSGTLEWACRPFGALQNPRWVLDWSGVSTNKAHQSLSANWLWGAMTRHYAVGLRSLRAPNALSFMPGAFRDGRVRPVPRWTLRVLVDVGSRGATSRVAELLPDPGELQLALPNAGTTTNEPLVVGVSVAPLDDRSRAQIEPDDKFHFLHLALRKASEAPESYECLVSGVLLDFGKAIDNADTVPCLRATLRKPAKRFAGHHGLDVELRLTLKSTLPRPANQDPERGFESEDIWRKREPSIVWDLAAAPQAGTVDIDETSETDQSRRLLLTVRPADADVAYQADAVVIDLEPFLVARVRAVSKAGEGGVFAAYRDDPDHPGGWTFASETGYLHVVLPPQAIGEEMIKGLYQVPGPHGSLVDVPIAGKVFDHRLSPPAQLLLDRNEVETARVLAPWALRRLFDQRLGVVGARLLRARFELLYGLTSVVADDDPDNPLWLRLAESDALVGEVPLSSQLRKQVLSRGEPQVRLTAYAENVRDWIRSLKRRPALLPVYRQWSARERLVIREGLYFELRESRETADPFQPHIPSVDGRPPSPRLPLRGGVDWGFESPNVYEEFLRTGKVQTNEERRKRGAFVPYGQIAGLSFGGLGGFGGQKAIFSNGKTHIISETTQGRIDSLTIVRIGRIAMLWHHARHVIVYERSTRTAPRYRRRHADPSIADQQPSGFEGLAALRKVKEYIEVTQPKRAYPDYPTAVPANAFLAGAFFETTIIPVKSSWGRDVQGGWVMHLRGPMVDAERPYYPEPKIFGELSRTAEKGGGWVSQPVEELELLKFFTSTREQDGADTDLWPAFPDVDIPLTSKPKPPKVPYLPTFAGMKRQPDAEETDFGQRRFSLHMRPSTEAVNLMQGRPVKGLDARVRTISIARGAAVSPVPVPSALAKLQEKCADDRAVVLEGLSEIASRVTLQRLAGEATNAGAMAPEMRKRLQEMARRAKGLRDAAYDTALGKDPWKDQQARLKSLAEKSAARLLAEIREPEQEAKFWSELWSAVKGADDAGQRVAQHVEVLNARLRNQILSQVSVAQVAVESFEAARDRSRSFATAVAAGALTSWAASLSEVRRQFDGGAIVAADDAFRAALGQLRTAVSSARDQAARQVTSWLGSFGDVVLNDSGSGPASLLTSAVHGLCDMLLALIDDALEYTPPFESMVPDWGSLGSLIPLDAGIADWFADVEKSVAKVVSSLQAHWESVREQALARLDTEVNAVFVRIKTDLAAAVAGDAPLRDRISKEMNAIWAAGADQMQVVVDRLGAALPSDLANLGVVQDVVTSLDGVLAKLGALDGLIDSLPVADLEQAVQSAVRDAEAAFGQMADRVEREVVGALVETAQGAVQPALEVTRAFAEGLVTEAISCSREWLGYYFDPNQLAVDVTRAAAVFNEMGRDALNSLSAQMPFDRIRDRMMAQLADFNVNELFPSFAGLQLQDLIGDLKVPPDPLAEYEWIKVKHGFDKDRLTAWADVFIDKTFEGETEVFDLSPIALVVRGPRFNGHSRIGGPDGSGNAQSTQAFLKADWLVKVNNEPVVTIERATLSFNESGRLDFDFSPDDVRLAPALQFITDALKDLLPADSGLTLLPLQPGGVRAELSLPLPDIGTGAFTMTGITLNTYFELQVVNGFEISTGLWLSKPDRPFGLAILFLGGGGWFGVDVRYRPPSTFVTRVSVGISAGAFIALNLSVIRGSAGLLFTAGLDYYRDSSKGGGGDLVVTVGILAWGEFSILSFISAYLRLVMRVEYRDGSMTSYGRVSISIKICWCYTFRCDRTVSMPFGGGGRRSSAAAPPRLMSAASEAGGLFPADAITARKVRIEDAVRSHLDSLSWS